MAAAAKSSDGQRATKPQISTPACYFLPIWGSFLLFAFLTSTQLTSPHHHAEAHGFTAVLLLEIISYAFFINIILTVIFFDFLYKHVAVIVVISLFCFNPAKFLLSYTFASFHSCAGKSKKSSTKKIWK